MITDNQLPGPENNQDWLKDTLQQKYNNKPKRMIRDTLPDGKLLIGKNRYDALKHKPVQLRLESEIELIKTFEDHHGITTYLEAAKTQHQESEKRLLQLQKRKERAIASINKPNTWKVFLEVFKKTKNVEFIQNENTLKNIAPLVLYFCKSPEFLNYGYKTENGIFLSQPSLDKGLLIIGGYGNGKTSIMNTFQSMFKGLDGYRFGRFSAKKLVVNYEIAAKNKNQELLENFWLSLTKSELYIDDVKSESDANAYGKVNVINTLIQERYNKNLKTHITCNYANGYNGDVKQALLEFKTRYSNQVYDRLFEMFNIIEFTGTSFRR